MFPFHSAVGLHIGECTIRPINSEDILHNSVHVLTIFYMNDKRYETLNLSIKCHNLIITGQCCTGKT